jgi:hypothetical protein
VSLPCRGTGSSGLGRRPVARKSISPQSGSQKEIHCSLHGRWHNRPELCRITCRRFSAWNHRSGEDIGTSTKFFSKMCKFVDSNRYRPTASLLRSVLTVPVRLDAAPRSIMATCANHTQRKRLQTLRPSMRLPATFSSHLRLTLGSSRGLSLHTLATLLRLR